MLDVNPRDFLAPNESIHDKITCYKPNEGVGYTIHTLSKNGEENDDDVILEIRDKTEPCVLIGGNQLELSTLQGFGRLAIIDLKTGDRQDITLEPGVETTVPSENTLYWYENAGDEMLVIRDHSDSFDIENEPTLANVVAALTV